VARQARLKDTYWVARLRHLIVAMWINLLNLQADFHEANSTSPENALELEMIEE
jgi:hypothetical protein